jgi:hypothetical protein
MKIKTIWDTRPDRFDERVNLYLEEGWLLGKREVIPDTRDLVNSVLYAELAMLDPVPEVDEPQPLDPFEALHTVREFCDTNQCEGCQLAEFCARHLPRNEGPADWELPGEEAPEA